MKTLFTELKNSTKKLNITILDDYFDTIKYLPCFSKIEKHNVKIFNDNTQNEDILEQRLKDTEVLVLIRERTKIKGSLLDKLGKNLKLISQRSTYSHIDVDACTRNGIILSSNLHSDSPCFAAAELTWGLILSVSRSIPQQSEALKKGIWQTCVGDSIRGKTIGIYGYGKIGKTIAGYAKAFGMNVCVYGSENSMKEAKEDGLETKDRTKFFSECDIITLHLRLVPSTKYIVTKDDLSLMKTSSILINTSRSQLIDTNVLVEAIKAGRPGRLGIDVFDEEPLKNPDHPLLKLDNVIATPHIGFITKDEFELQFNDIFDQIIAYENGNPTHVINKEVLKKND